MVRRTPKESTFGERPFGQDNRAQKSPAELLRPDDRSLRWFELPRSGVKRLVAFGLDGFD